MKKKIIKLISVLYLYRKYWKDYLKYYFTDRSKIKKALRRHGIFSVRPTATDNWKLWYNSCYFSGIMKDSTQQPQRVFIKIQGPELIDCFENEKIVNSYIDSVSDFLSKRKPRLLCDLIVDNYYILIYEFIDLKPVENDSELSVAIHEVLDEYSRIGVLHTDFGLINMGKLGEVYCFIDYGTSLCPHSNSVRIRMNYNQQENAVPAALNLFSNPDYYYDDAQHCCLSDIDRGKLNFLVGKGNCFYAKLGENVYKYQLDCKSKNGVPLLRKDGVI